jgi:hypothetical protein
LVCILFNSGISDNSSHKHHLLRETGKYPCNAKGRRRSPNGMVEADRLELRRYGTRENAVPRSCYIRKIEIAAQANDIPIWIIPDWNIVFAVYFHKNWPFSIFANILSIKCSNKKRNTYV